MNKKKVQEINSILTTNYCSNKCSKEINSILTSNSESENYIIEDYR